MYNKFIIEDDCLVFDVVKYHKQLANDITKVKGGGWFKFDKENNHFTFFGKSEDFGKFKNEDIEKAFKENKVFSSKAKIYPIKNISYEINNYL